MSDYVADLAAARDRIAMAAEADAVRVDGGLGALTLRPHQRTAVARLMEIITRYRGALLADPVGLGKTYVALSIGREHARPLVVCPGALRSMWERAMHTAGLKFPLLSIESLARGDRPAFEPDVVIIDEAHHLRTPSTRRYEAIAALAHRSRILLLSATPLHNTRRDLTAVLALFLGSGVRAWTDQELSRVIVRRDENSADQKLPTMDGPHALSPGVNDDCLDAICALPPAIPAANEGTAAALAAISMVHLWASSRAALVASLRTRRGRAIALKAVIASGRLPTTAELAAWHYADESVQLAFPFCVDDGSAPVDSVEVSRRLDAFISAVTELLAHCRQSPDPDVSRVALLRTLRTAHYGTRIVAFSQYAQTVAAFGRLLRADPGVAVVTGTGARIASGTVSREEILAQFAGDAKPAATTDRVDLLLSTDLLSEGVDLRGAAVIVHLDLPWNPTRLEQRVGRARRLGSAYTEVHVYTFVPPAAAERMLALRQRLAAKVRIAERIIGARASTAFGINAVDAEPARTPVIESESLRRRLKAWLDPVARSDSPEPIIAAADAPTVGWLAVVRLDGLSRFVHSLDGIVGEDPFAFLQLMTGVRDARPVDGEARAAALSQVQRWLSVRKLSVDVGLEAAYPPAKRAVLDRLARTVARAPRHRRATVLAAAQRARDGVASVAGVGAERILQELVRSPANDEAWIHSVATFGALHSGAHRPNTMTAGEDSGVSALILLAPHNE